MKRSLTSVYLVSLILIIASSGLMSQDLFSNAESERIEAVTDRTMYVSGEKILFSAVVFNVNQTDGEFSRIFYCELITSDGKKITGRKYLLQHSSGQGCLTIPEETISGIYFLKFYTRFMRNSGTDHYKYIMLKIINPLKTEVLKGNEAIDTAGRAANIRKGPEGDLSVNILSGKKNFLPREEIRIEISGNKGKDTTRRLCLSVIPGSTYQDNYIKGTNTLNKGKNGFYFPDTRGISLSGQLIQKESGKPVPKARVNLSIIGDKDFQVVSTDSSGKFFFALPDYHGNKDIFLCADDQPGNSPQLLIDNDFCSRPAHLPSPPFTLSEEEKKAAYKLAVNSRISLLYMQDTMVIDTSEVKKPIPFYGEPSEILVMDKYIELPTLEEYFTELPVIVKLKKVQGRKHFVFFTTQLEMSMYDPLVLVDWVAVNNIDKILAMSPLAIDRIELVNAPYYKGNIIYGGIISFVSRKKDFAGIDLPRSGTFINYSFLEECTVNFPSGSLHDNIPDSRNTVYWNPAVQANNEGSAVITMTAPDTPGKYHILLRGMNRRGEVVVKEDTFVVTGKGN